MRKFFTGRVAVALIMPVIIALAFAGTTVAKSTKSAHTQAGLLVCALLPDTTSSTRYTLFDAPLLSKAFKAGHVPGKVYNAQASPARQTAQAKGCLALGVKVLLLDQLDAASGKAITNLAVAKGVKVIDYDRLVVGSKASYYVSFNNVKVGGLQGAGLVAALKASGKYSQHPVIAELNGGITDNNAHLFKQGYDAILKPLYAAGTFKLADAGDQWTDWDPIKGRTIFDQMLTRNNNAIDGVLAANDGLAGAVIASLKAHNLQPIPLTGQDATPTGLQFILAGWQTGTVFKPIALEAAAAAKAAINIIRGQPVKTNGAVSGTKSILLTPIWVTKSNVNLVYKSGQVKKSDVCVGTYKQYC